MSDISCSSDFLSLIQRAFHKALTTYGFRLERCECEPGGRSPECRALYRGPQASLLFEFADGGFLTYLGEPDQPFPKPEMLTGEGSQGWYMLHLLIAARQGKPVYSRRIVKRIQDRKLDPVEFEAHLFERWADELLPLFAPGRPKQWREEFLQAYQRLLRGKWKRIFPFGR